MAHSTILFFSSLLLLSLPAGSHAQSSRVDPSAASQDEMVLIHGGTFQMGIDADEIPRFQEIFNIGHPDLFNDEFPKHTVTVADFYLDKHLVTNAQFKKFLRAKAIWLPKEFPQELDNGNYLQQWADPDQQNAKPDHPAVNINWDVANAFCGWAGKRLPTEAEWEFAARGGRDTLFPWGNDLPDDTRANFADNVGTTTPVESYRPNPFGLYDMAGNVWQFLADDWTKYPAHATNGDPQLVNREALESATLHHYNAARKVIRGGSYSGHPINLWVKYRDSHPVNGSQPFVGFRCAKSSSPKTPYR
jgi:formylglycine-generating enzyme